MPQIKQQFYNGKDWIEVTADMQLDQEGNPTGHMTELSREYINKFGIFDDENVIKTFKELVNLLQSQRMDSYYVCKCNQGKYYQIFSTYSLSPTFKNLADAVMIFLQSTGLIPESFEADNPEDPAIITLFARDRESDNNYALIIRPASDLVYTIGG